MEPEPKGKVSFFLCKGPQPEFIFVLLPVLFWCFYSRLLLVPWE